MMGDDSGVLALLKTHMELASQRDRAQVERDTETKLVLKNQGTRLEELHERVSKVERGHGEIKALAASAQTSARAALDSQSDLEGALLAEVGALATNDVKQNCALEEIRKETGAQSTSLDFLEKAEAARKNREDIVFWTITKGIPLLCGALITVGGALVWVATHWR